jgi:carbon-monoxide dehydrogenase medium subunit
VSVATWLALDGAGRVTDARIALGAVGPRPFRPRDAEAGLVGGPLDSGSIARAADLAAAAARPITHVRGGADYRTAMVRALVARCLDQATGG